MTGEITYLFPNYAANIGDISGNCIRFKANGIKLKKKKTMSPI